MAFEFKLPELGENIEQADIVKVMVSVGDKVEVDQILLEIETDKATVEVPSEFSGIVKSVNVKDGDTVKVGDVIFTFEDKAESESKEKEKGDGGNKIDQPSKEKAEKVEKKEISDEKTETSGGVVEFRLPELGENIESADITKVLVSVGDKVEIDQILFEIETHKCHQGLANSFCTQKTHRLFVIIDNFQNTASDIVALRLSVKAQYFINKALFFHGAKTRHVHFSGHIA